MKFLTIPSRQKKEREEQKQNRTSKTSHTIFYIQSFVYNCISNLLYNCGNAYLTVA